MRGLSGARGAWLSSVGLRSAPSYYVHLDHFAARRRRASTRHFDGAPGSKPARGGAMATTTQGPKGGWFTRERVLVLALAAVTVGAFYLCYRRALPFVPAITWALAIAVVAHPLHRWMRRRLNSKSLAAGLTVLIVTVTLLAPAIF